MERDIVGRHLACGQTGWRKQGASSKQRSVGLLCSQRSCLILIVIHSIRRVSLAYSDPSLASVELVQAILRQGTFIEKMVNMGWTTGGRFDTPKAQATLIRCITRYHGFLCLMATIPGHLLVPTLVSPSSITTLYLSDYSCRI